MSIQHDRALSPVTALEFLSGPDDALYILAGEGSHLKIFATNPSRLLLQVKVFSDQAIHGIAIRDGVRREGDLQVVIWGGAWVTLLKTSQVNELFENPSRGSIQHRAIQTSDWILHAAISPYDSRSCALVTAHNVVLHASFNEHGRALLRTVFSPSNSILYSAHIIWEELGGVLVAAGTVFGEIIVWKCSIAEDDSSSGHILSTFSRHEGSIFGVNISPVVTFWNGTQCRLVASCSDDRTIRVWAVDSKKSPESNAAGLSTKDLDRNTGFGRTASLMQGAEPCIAMVMGHASRIWRVQFLVGEPKDGINEINVLSFGEDSTVQQWALTEPQSHTSSKKPNGYSIVEPQSGLVALGHVKSFAFHSGKHIWSAARHSLQSAKNILATGGADGKISMYPVHLLAPEGCSRLMPEQSTNEYGFPEVQNSDTMNDLADSSAWSMEEILQQIIPALGEKTPTTKILPKDEVQDTAPDGLTTKKKKKPKSEPKDAFNRYAFVSSHDLLLTTTFGRVLLGQLRKCTIWEEIPLPESCEKDLASYAVVKGVPQLGVALLAGANGKIYLYRKDIVIQLIAQVERKVAEIFPLPESVGQELSFVVTTLESETAHIFTLCLPQAGKSPEVKKTVLQLPEKFMVTAAGKDQYNLVLGSRKGSLAIYQLMDQATAFWRPSDTRNGDAVTSITPLDHHSTHERSYFLTTGRNGMYNIFAVSKTSEDIHEIQLVHEGTPPPLGPNIEFAWFESEHDSTKDLILYGFKSKNFVVWNETTQSEVMSVECGGAHRSYAYSSLDNGGGYFAYTKASKFYLYAQRISSHQTIKTGGHGREIKACAIDTTSSLVATGAEDTNIRIWDYRSPRSGNNRPFNCIRVVQKHTAGIQHLQWYGSQYLLSSAGNEEFFIWAIEHIKGFGVGVVCEASCPDQTEDCDLRIMNFDVSPFPGSDQNESNPRLLISMAFSDSTMRVYSYSKIEGYRLLSMGQYTTACIMQIRHVSISRDELYILTAATDGHLVMWRCLIPAIDEAPQQLVLLSAHQLHQSSIKSLDFAFTSDRESLIVATGGDDNALGITIYVAAHLDLAPQSLILRSAHVAAITGLALYRTDTTTETKNYRIITSGNDQRVKEWILGFNENVAAMSLQKVGDAHTSVADVGDMVLFESRGSLGEGEELMGREVMVVGNGMEVLNVSMDGAFRS